MSGNDSTVYGAPLTSARNGLPGFRPYRWRDRDARRHREVERILASVRAHVAELDDGPDPNEGGYEFRREQLLGVEESPVRPEPAPAPVTAPEPTPPRCEKCGYLVTRCCCPGGPRS